MINIILVDDHDLIREGLKKVLLKNSDMQIVGEASNAGGLFDLLSKHKADIIILDITLPGRSGLDILQDLKEMAPKTRKLILSMHPEERFAIRAIRSGADGYITKQNAANELPGAIREIFRGKKYISPSLAEHLANEIELGTGRQLHENLSNREFEVLRKIANGKTVSQIADELSLSVNTVNSYRARILEKMNMKNTAEIIRYVLEHEIMD